VSRSTYLAAAFILDEDQDARYLEDQGTEADYFDGERE
jgi:hypothetical protein